MKFRPTTLTLLDQAGQPYQISSEDLITVAQAYVQNEFSDGSPIGSPSAAAAQIQVLLAGEQREVFYAVWLDNQHRIVGSGALAYGTLDSATIYPREVIKAALRVNAAAVIFAHNHPSGHSQPSEADKKITQKLKKALAYLDIRLLDHFILAKEVTSMAELGLL